MIRKYLLPSLTVVLLATAIRCPSPSLAHCDGTDGPVVKAAREALESGNVNLVLVRVREEAEPEIRRAFERTLSIRRLSPQARDLADTYFFETLVRVHRAGEGAPFTGLEPAGRDLGPAIPAAGRALESEDADPLTTLLVDAARSELQERFRKTLTLKHYGVHDLDAGRKYVSAYEQWDFAILDLRGTALATLPMLELDRQPNVCYRSKRCSARLSL